MPVVIYLEKFNIKIGTLTKQAIYIWWVSLLMQPKKTVT